MRPFPAITTIYAHNHSVVNERYRYTRYADGSEEFYDRKKDLHEFDNLMAEDMAEEHAATIKILRAWIPKEEAGKPDLVDDRVKKRVTCSRWKGLSFGGSRSKHLWGHRMTTLSERLGSVEDTGGGGAPGEGAGGRN